MHGCCMWGLNGGVAACIGMLHDWACMAPCKAVANLSLHAAAWDACNRDVQGAACCSAAASVAMHQHVHGKQLPSKWGIHEDAPWCHAFNAITTKLGVSVCMTPIHELLSG